MEAASRTLVSWSLIRPITGITNRTAKSTVTLLKESTSTVVLGLRKRVVMELGRRSKVKCVCL